MSSNNINKKVKKQPTSHDVARLSGVSRATVSNYINKTRYVSSELSERIQSSIDLLKYTPNEVARALKTQNYNAIGLVIPSLSSFFLPIIQSIDEMVHSRGYSMLLASSVNSPDRERENLQLFTTKKVKGILIAPCGYENAKYINSLISKDIIIVQVNRRIESILADSVTSNTELTYLEAVRFLVEKRNKKRIALFGYNPNNFPDKDKLKGYEKGIAEYHLQKYIIEFDKFDAANKGEVLINHIVKYNLDGILCISRTFMEVAYPVIIKLNKKVPDELSIIGYDDPIWSTFFKPTLSTITENRYEMGDKAVNLMFERIENDYEAELKHIYLKTKLIIRQT